MASSTKILVRLRRIDRMYDLHFGEHSKGFATRILPATDRSPHPQVFDPLEDQRDDNGRVIKAITEVKVPPPRPGIYRSYWVADSPHVLRTFVRGPGCEPPRPGAWVYVLSDQAKVGDFRLVHILHYRERGKYALCALDDPERAIDKQPEDELLHLWEVVLGAPVRNCAVMSPFPLPATVVKALREPSSDDDKTLVAGFLRRASWVNDPFFCDIVRGADTHTPATKQADEVAKDGDTMAGERVLYLMNPFHEAEGRIDAFQEAIHRALDAQQVAAQDPRYLSGKRIQAASTGNPRLVNLVQPALNTELNETEDPILFFCLVAEERAADLLRWCGYPYEPSGWSWFDPGISHHTWKIDSVSDHAYKVTALPYTLAPQQTGVSNALSAAMVEAHDVSDEWKELVDDVRDRAYSNLLQTEVGRRFLKKQADRILEQEPVKPGSDDGLLGVLWLKEPKEMS
jgi:hypothetical protein